MCDLSNDESGEVIVDILQGILIYQNEIEDILIQVSQNVFVTSQNSYFFSYLECVRQS